MHTYFKNSCVLCYRMVESFAETSELHRDDINFNQELGHHLPQQQVELEWKEIAQRYKSEINSLEDRHNAEMKRMHSQFEQEKVRNVCFMNKCR